MYNIKNMNIINYDSRKGSKCYFYCDIKDFNHDMESLIKTVSFYTLSLFGHVESIGNVLVKIDKKYKTVDFFDLLKQIYKNKINAMVFHQPNKIDKNLMSFYKGQFVSKQLDANSNLDIKCENVEYSNLLCKCRVKTYTDQHTVDYLENNNYNTDYLLLTGNKVSDTYEYMESNTQCILCNNYYKIDENTFKLNDNFYKKKKVNCSDYFDYSPYETITLNNLIFDFEKYTMNIISTRLSDTKPYNMLFKVTFDKKAIGGFKHASFCQGAEYLVTHAVPGTLEHVSTSHIDSITVNVSHKDDKIFIESEYIAIDDL